MLNSIIHFQSPARPDSPNQLESEERDATLSIPFSNSL